MLGQSCSHGEHIKCSPARAELAINLMPFGQPRTSRVQYVTHRTGLSELKKVKAPFGAFFL